MGKIIQARKFSSNNQAGLFKPVIYCCSCKCIVEQAVSINVKLSQELLKYEPKRRTFMMEKCFAKTISNLPDNCIIKDFDVMFNPAYKIDVLKIMVNCCKTKPFSIVWAGKLEGDRLIYADTNYKDYKEFNVADYDVTCVI